MSISYKCIFFCLINIVEVPLLNAFLLTRAQINGSQELFVPLPFFHHGNDEPKAWHKEGGSLQVQHLCSWQHLFIPLLLCCCTWQEEGTHIRVVVAHDQGATYVTASGSCSWFGFSTNWYRCLGTSWEGWCAMLKRWEAGDDLRRVRRRPQAWNASAGEGLLPMVMSI
jgi:hypothetical protein